MECGASSQLMKSVLSEVRRARPLLGTFVEITARAGGDEAKLHGAIDKAFAAISTVHRLMSFHDPASDISRLNAEAAHKPVRVHRWTHRVLRLARNFSQESDGAFDITVASLLRAWRFLPRTGTRPCRGDWRDIILERDGKVRFRRPLLVDLGGIAKGFAVDRATAVLIAAGVRGGIVNAGGDLRVFGSVSRRVHIRHPLAPERPGGVALLKNRAFATSATYFSRRKCGNRVLSPLVDGRTRESCVDHVSVSVAAPDCLTADALTKVVLALRSRACPVLERHDADAVLLERDLPPRWLDSRKIGSLELRSR